MSIADDFLDPIIYTKRTQGFVQKTENLLISGNRVLLDELPCSLQKVTINYNVSAYSASSTYVLHDICSYSGSYYRCTTAITSPEAWDSTHWTVMTNGMLMTEIVTGTPLEGQYKVSYITGIITFNAYDNAKSVNCVYFGTGRFFLSANMIYVTATNDLVEETLDDLITNVQDIIDSAQYMVYGIDSESSDDYVITLSPAPTAYIEGMLITFKANTVNTGACTLNVNGLGAKTIKKSVSTDLSNSDILAGQIIMVIYDGTNFQLI